MRVTYFDSWYTRWGLYVIRERAVGFSVFSFQFAVGPTGSAINAFDKRGLAYRLQATSAIFVSFFFSSIPFVVFSLLYLAPFFDLAPSLFMVIVVTQIRGQLLVEGSSPRVAFFSPEGFEKGSTAVRVAACPAVFPRLCIKALTRRA